MINQCTNIMQRATDRVHGPRYVVGPVHVRASPIGDTRCPDDITMNETPIGPMTRSREKEVRHKVNSLLSYNEFDLSMNGDMLCVLRYEPYIDTQEDSDDEGEE